MIWTASPPFTRTIGPILTSYVDFAITYMDWPSKPKKTNACRKPSPG